MLLLTAAATPCSVDDKILADEKRMWEMWKRKDPQSFAALLADDFYDVYLSGETAGKTEVVNGIREADLLEYKLTPIKVVAISGDARVLLYRAHIRGRVAGHEKTYDVDVTSAWALRKGKWLSVFYRENLIPAGMPWKTLSQ